MNDKEMIEEMAKVIQNADSRDCFYECEQCESNVLLDCGSYIHASALYNAGYRKIPENAVVLTEEEYKKYKSAIWLTLEEYQQYHRFLVDWNCGEIKRVKQDNSKNGIVHLARRKNEANGYIVNKDKLIYFSNMLNGYEYKYKNLQEVCNEMNSLLKRFDSYEEQLAFWKGKAEQARCETAREIFDKLIALCKESRIYFAGDELKNDEGILYLEDLEDLAKQYGVDLGE